jgi:hypothetical protein
VLRGHLSKIALLKCRECGNLERTTFHGSSYFVPWAYLLVEILDGQRIDNLGGRQLLDLGTGISRNRLKER